MMNRLMKGIAVLMAVCGFAGAARAETAMFNGMPIEYTGATTNWVGGDLVLSFTTVATYNDKGVRQAINGSLALPRDATADILVVGGGGSGAKGKDKNYGAGGNGGAVVYQAGVSLSAGTYAMSVGPGGAVGTDKGGNAGRVSEVLSGGTSVYSELTAAGGDGAPENSQSPGVAGSSGAGSDSYDITGASVTYGAGAVSASSDRQGVSGAANTGNGGQGYSKDYNPGKDVVVGAGGSGIVVVRIKSMSKPSFVFQNQTVEYFGAEIVSQTEDGILLKYASGMGSIDLPKMALADYLVVGGGGSGGTTGANNKFGASGNGGAVKEGSYAPFQSGAYTITVGAGGASQTAQKSKGNDGQTSRIDGPTAISAVGGEGGRGGDGDFAAAGSPISGTTSSMSGAEVVYGRGGEKTTSKDAILGGAVNTGNGGMGGNNEADHPSGAGGSGIVYIYIHSFKDYVVCDSVEVETGHSVTIPNDTRWGEERTLRTTDATIAVPTAAGADVSVLGKKPGETTVMVEAATTVYAYSVTVTGNTVVRIGDVYYASLEDAVAAAKDGETITLLGNATLAADLTISKNITIASESGASYSISRSAADANLIVSGTVTFSNVTLGGADEPDTYTEPMVEVAPSGLMTLADGSTLAQPKLTFQGQAVAFNGAEVTSVSGSDGMLLKYSQDGKFDTSAFALVDYLVVGGGGSGGTRDGDGKFAVSGNGGAVKSDENVWLLPDAYQITVGAGGAAQTEPKSVGSMGGPSSLVGESVSVSAAGGGGGDGGGGDVTPAAGKPETGVESSITGTAVIYGAGGALADATNRGTSGADYSGCGGVAGGKTSGAGGSGVVYLRIRTLKPLVRGNQTVVAGETLTIPADTRWGDTWTVKSYDPAFASATAAGSDVRVLGREPGVARVMVENATTVYEYDVTVTPFEIERDVLLSNLDGATKIVDVLGKVESLTVTDESVLTAEVREGALYLKGLKEDTAKVTLTTSAGTYTFNVRAADIIVKNIDLVKSTSSATSYSYTFTSIERIEGDGEGVVSMTRDGNTVTFTALEAGETCVIVHGDVGEGAGDVYVRYVLRVKSLTSGIEPFGDTYIGYTGATEKKWIDDELVLVFRNVGDGGSFSVPAPYTANVDVLAVGGGGAGGTTTTWGEGGGGGGAGGFTLVEDRKFQTGTFYIAVGEGGRMTGDFVGAALRGVSGGDSVITNAYGYAFVEARGGGGGGAPANPTAANGLTGGSGGGAVWYQNAPGVAGSGVGGEGMRGGVPSTDGQGGGGGGANGIGGADRTGGAGKECDITGETVVYAQGGMGGRDDTVAPVADATGIGFGGNGGNGGVGGSGADGAVIVRIKGLTRNIKVPIPTTNDIIRARYVWQDGATFKGLEYDETTKFRSSTDAHLYRWEDAIASVTGTTSATCSLSETEVDSEGKALKLGAGYYNFTIKLNDGYTWEDRGGPDSPGTTGTVSYRWSVVEDASVDEAAIDILKKVSWTDESNAELQISTFTSPESMNKRPDGVLVLGSLCFSHGFYSNIYDRALSAIAEVSDSDYYWWYANPTTELVKSDKGFMYGNTNTVNGTAITGHLTKGEPYVYPWGLVGDSHDTGGQHGCLAYFYDMLYKVMEAEKNGGKKYGYIVLSFDGTKLSDTGYKTQQEAAGYVLPHPHEREIVEWLATNFYKEGSVIWLDSESSLTGVSGTSSLNGLLDPYSYLNGGTAHSGTTSYPDQEYWTQTTVTTNVNKQGTSIKTNYTYGVYQNQTYYGDADEVAKLLKSKIKIKPYDLVLTDKLVSPEKGLTIQRVTLQACTNGVGRTASSNEADWTDLLVWEPTTGTGVFPANESGETWGIPDASLTVNADSNEMEAIVKGVDYAVWARLKVEIKDDGQFRTSEDAIYNNATGLWEKNPNDGKAFAEMFEAGSMSMHVEGEAETSVPWSFPAYPVKVTVKNGDGFIDGKDIQLLSICEGRGCTVYYRGWGGYRISKLIVDGEEKVIDGYEYSYSFDNIDRAHEVYVEYEPYFGTVTSAPVTNVYDGAVHPFDVTLAGWDEDVPTEVRYARWEDRNDETKYYTAEEFLELYGSDPYVTPGYNPDELTDVGDHEIAYRVFALQTGYGKTFTDEGWVWVRSSEWESVEDACGTDHSVITPAPLVVRPEKSHTIAVNDPLPEIGIDIGGLLDGETLVNVLGPDEATADWKVDSSYTPGDGMGQYPTWVVDKNNTELGTGDPMLLDPDEGDWNFGNYYILPAENFQAVVKIPLEIGDVPQGPGLDPELPYVDTGVKPVIKMYDGVTTGLVVKVTSTEFGTTELLKEGEDYEIFWGLGDLNDPKKVPEPGSSDNIFLHVGTNVVWYFVKPIEGTDADDHYFAASNYNYVIITPRPLELESPSGTWEYTGETHRLDEVRIVSGNLVGGDTLDPNRTHTTAEITHVGSTENVFTWDITSGDPKFTGDAKDDYDVTVHYGTLKVTPTSITIGDKEYPKDPTVKVKYGDTGVEDAIRVYDGIPTNIVVDVRVPEEDDRYEVSYCWTTNGVDVTDWSTELPLFTNVVDAVVYFKVTPINEYSNDYVPASGFARVIVTPADVTVKADDKYIAVGDPLPEYTAVIGEVVPGNVIDYDEPTSPTYEGAKGEYPIQVTGEELQGNYRVTYEPGTLYVIELGVALWIVDHEERDDGRCYLAFEPQIKEGQNFLAWLRYARDRGHVYVKYGRTWKECDECEPIQAFAREHRKETGAYYRDCGDGERDAAKGWMWIQVDLPRTTVLPLGYWRVYIDEPESSFTYGGRYKIEYVDDATGEPIPGVEPERGRAAKGTTVTAHPKDIPGWVCVKEPDVKEVTIETDQEHVFTYRYVKTVSYRVRYIDAMTGVDIYPESVRTDIGIGTHVIEYPEEVRGYIPILKTLEWVVEIDGEVKIFPYYPNNPSIR